ncbi:MAG: hypothetical protein IJR33_02460 [Clostridia bacterium]|nr:hypothetical protein [Clostridia bacterium]
MANKIQIRRGTKAKLPTLSAGEPAFCPDTRELFVGTGSGNVNMGGSQWYTGTAMSGTSATTGAYSYSACPQVKVGDIYLNTSNGNVYQCTTAGSGSTAKWTYKGCLKGADGAKGDKGDAASSQLPIYIGKCEDWAEYCVVIEDAYGTNGVYFSCTESSQQFILRTDASVPSTGFDSFSDIDFGGGPIHDLFDERYKIYPNKVYLCEYKPTSESVHSWNGDLIIIGVLS